VTWSSSSPGVATISNAAGSKGLATAIAPGTTSTTAFTVAAAALGTATLAWDPPTTYTDGTPVTNITGFRIYYGTVPGSYSKVIDTGNTTTWTITGLSSGAWYFVVTAYDSFGMESDYSNELSKIVP
jgi:hypothetical protein